jgi:hypothetical protein
MLFRAALSPLARRYAGAAFLLCLAAILYLSLAPSEATPAANLGWDKARHALAYFVLTGLGLFAFGSRPVLLGASCCWGPAWRWPRRPWTWGGRAIWPTWPPI